MASVEIQRYPEAKEPVWSLLDETRSLFDQIQKRAYNLFEGRGGGDGMALDDWLRAETDAVEIPKSELTEEDGKLHVKAAVPGLAAKDLHVTATPHELVIRGEMKHEDEGRRGKVYFREFNQKQMFRRFDLPAEVDVEHINAELRDGILDIDLPKAAQHEVKVTEGATKTAKAAKTAAA